MFSLLCLSILHNCCISAARKIFMQNSNYKTVSKLLFPEQQEIPQNASYKFDDILRRDFHNMQQERFKRFNPSISQQYEHEEKYREIANFIKNHVLTVGKEQAVRDFQAGINFLHIDIKDFIKEDGDFGENTFKAFFEICKFYGLDVIKESIRKGAVSNAVLDTTENSEINTDFLVHNINKNLNTNKEVF